MKLLIVLPICTVDCLRAVELLDWMDELGAPRENDCLLVLDCKLEKETGKRLATKAAELFKSVKIAVTPFSLPDERWPIGANWMFETALRWMKDQANAQPFLWLEADAVPTREGWLEQIEAEYDRVRSNKPFLGQVVKPGKKGLPERMLSGIAVYPANAHETYLRLLQVRRRQAWDVAFADVVMPQAQHSLLFWNFWGESYTVPPTFVEERGAGSPKNALEFSEVPKSAALAHRCKDGSLIEILRGKQSGSLLQVLLKRKYAKGRFAPGRTQIEIRQPTVWHCVERHWTQDGEERRRVAAAFDSWTALYKTGKVKPVHYWWYRRDSRALGDDRALPFLKDVLCEGMNRAVEGDVIMLTNDDTKLDLELAKVLTSGATKLPVSSFRANHEKGQEPITRRLDAGALIDAKFSETPMDLGRDLFAFEKSWLQRAWHSIPDFLLGELEWDLVLAVIIRQAHNIASTRENLAKLIRPAELEMGYVHHEAHDRKWIKPELANSPSKAWNRKLMFEWYGDNDLHSLITGF